MLFTDIKKEVPVSFSESLFQGSSLHGRSISFLLGWPQSNADAHLSTIDYVAESEEFQSDIQDPSE